MSTHTLAGAQRHLGRVAGGGEPVIGHAPAGPSNELKFSFTQESQRNFPIFFTLVTSSGSPFSRVTLCFSVRCFLPQSELNPRNPLGWLSL